LKKGLERSLEEKPSNMTHKVHPKIFRIKEITNWESRWFEKKKFPQYLREDFAIREFLKRKLGNIGVEKIEIERSPTKINIFISTARPALIIGRRGEGIEQIRSQLEKIISKKEEKKEIKLEILEIKNPWSSAALVAQWISRQIEQRIPYRRILKQALDKIMANKEIKGARVQVAGRLDGIEIARTEWLKRGRLPRQTLRSEIDYGVARAYCTYGIVGIKVWIYKGEKF